MLLIISHLLIRRGIEVGRRELFALSILLKLGLAPFYEWVISLNIILRWALFGLLRTFQKLGPLLASGHIYAWHIYSVRIFLSTLVAVGLRGLSTHFRNTLGLSSIFNTSWLLTLRHSPNSLSYVFLLYSYAFIVLVSMLSSFFTISPGTGLLLSFLRLGGLPPLPGRAIKLIVISELLAQGHRVALGVFFIVRVWFLLVYLWISVYLLTAIVIYPRWTLARPKAWNISRTLVALPMLFYA